MEGLFSFAWKKKKEYVLKRKMALLSFKKAERKDQGNYRMISLTLISGKDDRATNSGKHFQTHKGQEGDWE